MNYLLDTHVFLWMLSEPGRLNRKAVQAIHNPDHAVFVSAVSGVEIAIKAGLGKLEVPDGLADEINSRGLQELPLTFRHGEALAALPLHHADPFDRMLLAQALEEDLVIITHDAKMERYAGVKLLMT
ncbi:MAG: type II toxin-antitoxin system VapC family toxin [Oceanipulchritudo sp.]